MGEPKRFAMVCAANMNRSMEGKACHRVRGGRSGAVLAFASSASRASDARRNTRCTRVFCSRIFPPPSTDLTSRLTRHARAIWRMATTLSRAHKVLLQAGLDVSSYGAGNHVKLPGASRDSPNVYEFGRVTYKQIYDDLMSKDPELYKRNGLKDMLERNMTIKPAPQRWQEHSDELDVVVCFEERVFDNVVEDMRRRGGGGTPLLVVNLNVTDSHAEALKAGPQALKLCRMIEASEDWECECDEIMDKFQAEEGRRPLYSICFY